MAIACTLALATLVGALEAKAQLIPLERADWKAPGDGRLILDRKTGLEWSAIAAPNAPYNDVVTQFGPGGAFEGFRYASTNEVLELWSHAGITVIGGASAAANAGPVGALRSLGMGINDDNASSDSYCGRTGDAGPEISGESTHQLLCLVALVGFPRLPYRAAAASVRGSVKDSTRASLGSWLVRRSASPPLVHFGDFSISRAVAQFGDLPVSSDRAKLVGTFIPSPNSNGIDLLHENVAVTMGSSTLTIPGGSLVASDSKFTFSGNIQGTDVSLLFQDTGGGFEFRVMLTGLTLANTSNPLVVGLRIGDDFGEALVRLQGTLKLTADD